MEINNPIIPGFYPDPSIIHLDGHFYMVHSSFEYFPAIPLWHSKDLKHWRQIGHVVDRTSQGLDLSRVQSSGGVQAATIRYHQGTFYVTSTRVNPEWPSDNYHFVVTTKDINGPWGSCHFIEDAPGIDSSLYFENNRAYFLANRQKNDSNDSSNTEIWMQELNLKTFRLEGPRQSLWAGTGGIFPEGPRLFKRGDLYVLVIAEGGTLHHHTVTVATSHNLWGPYRSSPRNPILTHKHLSRDYPIQNVGHADMVYLKNGTTIGVCLGSRPRGGFYDGGNTQYSFGGYYRNLGRETFVFPVTWPNDDQGPLFSATTGKIESKYTFEGLKEFPQEDIPVDFSEASLRHKWVTRKQDRMDHVQGSLGQVTLILNNSLDLSFFGTRQTAWNKVYHVKIDTKNLGDGTAIFTAFITEASYIGIEFKHNQIDFVSVYQNNKMSLKTMSSTRNRYDLKLEIRDQAYAFYLDNLNPVVMDGRILSCDLNDAHTGVMIGFTGYSKRSESVSLFDFQITTA